MKTLKLGRKEASLFIKDFWLLRQNCLKTKKKSRVSCIKEYFKVFFRENRMSITPRTEEEMHLQNMLTALIKIDIRQQINSMLLLAEERL